MTDRDRWRRHQERWEAERLKPALERSPERRSRFITQSGVEIDRVYTSTLTRATDTARIALEAAGIRAAPTVRSSTLDERKYGELQGLEKTEAKHRFGAEQLRLWRRS